MPIQNEEIAEVFKNRILAWNSKDTKSLSTIYKPVGGFGYRAFAWRDYFAETDSSLELQYEQFLNGMEYYRIEIVELNTWSEGDTGLEWGIYNENFKQKGRPPEKANVRFTFTFKKYPAGWRYISHHTEIQPFDDNGQYPFELTKVE